jgi:hypothetical protein
VAVGLGVGLGEAVGAGDGVTLKGGEVGLALLPAQALAAKRISTVAIAELRT